MPGRRSYVDKQRYFQILGKGATQSEACRIVGIDRKTGRAWEDGVKNSSGNSFREQRELRRLGDPIPYNELPERPAKALEDFEYFRRVYFGRISSPWQIDAADKFQTALWTPNREYIVLNCPPGAGKSTLIHDVEAWLTVKNRGIRGLLGSAVQRLAAQYCRRLKVTFERVRPPSVDPALVAAGRAVEPLAALSQDYGRFQPDTHDLWQQEQFVIAQFGDLAVGEKEPTWQAYGLDTDYLGNRLDISVWDDVVTKRTMQTAEAIEKQRDKWDDEAESRLEPGGALFLVGQRLGPVDLYNYNLSKLAAYQDEEEESDYDDDLDELLEPYLIEPEGSQIPKMYHRVVYPAHDEINCKNIHSRKEAKPWPDGCLLEPVRLPWRDLSRIEKHRNDKYRTVYQQEDIDPESVLVPRHWIAGGEHNGEIFPGCYDTERGHHELPKTLNTTVYSLCTVDPSPTEFWSIQWWLYDEESEFRHLMELIRQKMDAGSFLDYDPDTRKFSGALEDVWQLSDRLNRPIRYLIIERNGAQRFLMQLDYFKRWCQLRGVSYFPHDTYGNKSDEEYGVQTLATHYRHGRYRLPNKAARGDMGFIITRQLVDEVTVWPNGTTDDCVMAQWFMEWWIPRIVMPNIKDIPRKKVPSWASE